MKPALREGPVTPPGGRRSSAGRRVHAPAGGGATGGALASRHFRLEPLPFDHLGHLPTQAAGFPEAHRAGRLWPLPGGGASLRRVPSAGRRATALRRGSSSPGARPVASRRARVRRLDLPLAGVAAEAASRRGDAGDVQRGRTGGRSSATPSPLYLASLGGPVSRETPAARPARAGGSPTHGETLFNSIGCSVCHPQGNEGSGDRHAAERASMASLPGGPAGGISADDLGSKTTAEQLADYLMTRWPSIRAAGCRTCCCEDKEAQDLARYLCPPGGRTTRERFAEPCRRRKQRWPRSSASRRSRGAVAAFEKLSEAAQWLDLGKRLVIEKGAIAATRSHPDGKPLRLSACELDFDQIKSGQSPGARLPGSRPRPERQRRRGLVSPVRRTESLARFLVDGGTGAGSPRPPYTARVALQHFNCLACHSRDGEGGLTHELIDELRQLREGGERRGGQPAAADRRGPQAADLVAARRADAEPAGHGRGWACACRSSARRTSAGCPKGSPRWKGPSRTTRSTASPLDAGEDRGGPAPRRQERRSAASPVTTSRASPTRGTRGPDLAAMNAARSLRLVSPLAGAAAAHAARHAHAAAASPRANRWSTLLDGGADAQAGGDVGLPVAGHGLAAAGRHGAARRAWCCRARTGRSLLRTFMPDAGVAGRGGRLSGRRRAGVRCGDLPAGLCLVGQLPRRRPGVG